MNITRYIPTNRKRTPNLWKSKKGNKYHAQKVKGSPHFPEIANRLFDSKFEAHIAYELCVRQRAGEIKDLKFQVTAHMTEADITWCIDFCYTEKGELIYHEAKGDPTGEYKLKLKLYKVYGPARIRITSGTVSERRTVEYYPRLLNRDTVSGKKRKR